MTSRILAKRDYNEPTFESLVKYGTAFEISPEEAASSQSDSWPHGGGGGPDLPVDANPKVKAEVGRQKSVMGKEIEDDANAVRKGENAFIRSIICTPRNPDGTVSREEMQKILNSILPPIQWTESRRTWRKLVSNMPGTRQDLRNLQTKLDTYLKQMRARETGLCPIREKLYSQLFDELIRQVTITCIERGILLVRIRNEMNHTIQEYKNLFASSTACAIRKALLAETTKAEMEAKIESTFAKIEKKKSCLAKLQRIYSGIDRKNIIRYETIKAKHANQYAALKEENAILKQKLENIILPRKGGG